MALMIKKNYEYDKKNSRWKLQGKINILFTLKWGENQGHYQARLIMFSSSSSCEGKSLFV